MMMETHDVLSRKIVISEPITDDLAGVIIERIMNINDIDAQMSVVSTYEPEPIEMFINSGGGSSTAGFAIISAMEMSTTPIVTYGMGCVASMALGIFVSGHIRVATRFCRFMYHSVAYGMEGMIKDHEDALRESSVIQDLYDTLFLERTKLTKTTMEKIKKEKRDFFISPSKAVQLGFADEIAEKNEFQLVDVDTEQAQ